MDTRRCFVVVTALLSILGGRAFADVAERPVWDLERLGVPPAVYPAPEFQEEGVTAAFFEGLPFHGNPTRVFAWYAIPPVKKGQRCPGMVMVHGGGGTAFAFWVRLWKERGYAAIAIDTCGSVPKGTYAHWDRHAMGGPPGWGGFDKIDEPATDQWPYHAVADVILAHSLLRSFPEVDADRIGITGTSWGGYLTCIVAGVDNRFKFAVPVYGCGFLGEDSAWLDVFKSMGPEKARKWLDYWDPSVYLPHAAMPMLWVTGPTDFAYPMPSLQKSYRLPPGPRTLAIRVGMVHAHYGPSENPEEIKVFADSITRGRTPLIRITGQGHDDRRAWVRFTGTMPATKAELNYTTMAGIWKERAWETVPAKLNRAEKTATATIPDAATAYYFNVFDDRGCVVSSEHETPTRQKP